MLRDGFKKPNFTLAEMHGRNSHNLFTSTSSMAQRQASANANGNRAHEANMINDRRLDAKASHFKVGFEPTYGPKGLDSGKKGNSIQAMDTAKFAENKLKMAKCNIVMGPTNETNSKAIKQNLQTSNQTYFRWIQPKVDMMKA